MAKFEKGKSGNLNGRPKGSRNKPTGILRETIADGLLGHIEKLPQYLDQISDPYQKVMVLCRLMKYFMPEIKAIEINDLAGLGIGPPDLSHLSYSELNALRYGSTPNKGMNWEDVTTEDKKTIHNILQKYEISKGTERKS